MNSVPLLQNGSYGQKNCITNNKGITKSSFSQFFCFFLLLLLFFSLDPYNSKTLNSKYQGTKLASATSPNATKKFIWGFLCSWKSPWWPSRAMTAKALLCVPRGSERGARAEKGRGTSAFRVGAYTCRVVGARPRACIDKKISTKAEG